MADCEGHSVAETSIKNIPLALSRFRSIQIRFRLNGYTYLQLEDELNAETLLKRIETKLKIFVDDCLLPLESKNQSQDNN